MSKDNQKLLGADELYLAYAKIACPPAYPSRLERVCKIVMEISAMIIIMTIFVTGILWSL